MIFSDISLVEYTLTTDCNFKSLSSDHNAIFLDIANAMNGESSWYVTNFNASLTEFLNSSTGTKLIRVNNILISFLNSASFKPDFCNISFLLFNVSLIMCSGECSVSLEDKINSRVFEDFIKAEISMFVSITISNYINPL